MLTLVRDADNFIKFGINNEDFRTLAIRLHGDQKYGDLPYSIHLSMVENALVNAGYDSFEYRASAWLHDSIEDTEATLQLLYNYYGPNVAEWVFACTGEGDNRKERNASIYTKLAATPLAAPVKVADRYINMRYGIITGSHKLEMYIGEFAEFSNVVRPLMTGTKKGSVLWNLLEDAVVQAIQVTKEKKALAA
jgi:(p)ppGpp synthase/HD superfamily hydrolase